jgi:hypothetical protein
LELDLSQSVDFVEESLVDQASRFGFHTAERVKRVIRNDVRCTTMRKLLIGTEELILYYRRASILAMTKGVFASLESSIHKGNNG